MTDAEDVADRLNSAAIHLLRRLRREDQGRPSPATLSALSVVVYGGPVSIGQLAEAEQVRSPTMTRMVDQMVRGGLVSRESHTTDGRSTLVRATEAGKTEIIEGRRRRVQFLAGRLGTLSDSDLQTIRTATDLIAQVIDHPHHS